MALSKDAASGSVGPRTMKFQGDIQGHRVTILIDSGSSHSFISQTLAAQLPALLPLQSSVRVQVANGGIMHCEAHLPQGQWFVQGYQFTSDLKVLSLNSYELIIGMDWLEEFSPMQVHWAHKWMKLPYKGATAILQGILPQLPEIFVIQLCSLVVDPSSRDAVSAIPKEIAAALSDFEYVFAPISALPPERTCDHTIHLIPGAKPVHVRA
jgi:hypothetical protein